jgi:hypothetical protein
MFGLPKLVKKISVTSQVVDYHNTVLIQLAYTLFGIFIKHLHLNKILFEIRKLMISTDLIPIQVTFSKMAKPMAVKVNKMSFF